MFDLEKAISAWRASFEHHRAFSGEDIEELDRHLRDDVQFRCKRGQSEEDAFREAVRRIGDYGSVEVEYRKVFWEKIRFHRRSVREVLNELSMFNNYLRIAIRNLLRHKGYSFINISGLAVGMACFILILLFVRHELSYDQEYEDADRIVRVLVGDRQVFTPTILSERFPEEFPEVLAATRIYPLGMFRPVLVNSGEKKFEEDGFFYGDSATFNVFSLPFISGDPATALNRPNTVVLTQSTAERYFGSEDPTGRFIQVEFGKDYEITGVIEDIPSNSHLQFDFLGSFSSTKWASRIRWGSQNFYTYLKLNSANDIVPLEAKIDALVDKGRAEGEIKYGSNYSLNLQRITDIRLHFEGQYVYVLLFSTIALMILLIACANYMNLSTARSEHRAREVGIRKVSGANRGQLTRQFYGESAMLALISMTLAALIVQITLPLFNTMSGKDIVLDWFGDPLILPLILGIAAFVTLAAGSYPALLLSSFRPAAVLKSSSRSSTGSYTFRRILVVFQFAVTMFLLEGAMIVYQQLGFMQTKALGFDKEHVVYLSMSDQAVRDSYETIKDELLSQSGIQSVSGIYSVPGYQKSGYGAQFEGINLGEDIDNSMLVTGIPADVGVSEVLDLTIIAGTAFQKSDASLSESGSYRYLVNKTLVDEVGWTPDEAVGKKINLVSSRLGEIVGVYDDFHYLSLHETIRPQVLFIEPSQYSYLMVRLAPLNVTATLAGMEETWERFAPHRPFEYRFLDAEYDVLYRSDRQTATIVSVFAILAALIAGLGLIGLASYSAEQRRKEIGVRKALGASVTQIVGMLSTDFTRLVLIAFVVASPISYFIMKKWLENFAYRIDTAWWIFVVAGVLATFVALLAVSYQSIRAASADPIESLRYD